MDWHWFMRENRVAFLFLLSERSSCVMFRFWPKSSWPALLKLKSNVLMLLHLLRFKWIWCFAALALVNLHYSWYCKVMLSYAVSTRSGYINSKNNPEITWKGFNHNAHKKWFGAYVLCFHASNVSWSKL